MRCTNLTTAAQLIPALLNTVENDIVPLTAKGVASGSKVFGAAILSRSTLSPLTVATNNEQVSPLLHGEINCIQKFFTVDYKPPKPRPNPKDTIFLATHEPCSLCLSGITWSGFNEFYYLFTYEDSKNIFKIPYDIDILESVYRVQGHETAEQLKERPLYNKTNKFFKARSINDLVDDLQDEGEREKWRQEILRVKALYTSLSETYQQGKKNGTDSASQLQ
ncbi:cytidine and deoxycytidylate deaminase zinc-binding region [Beauveria bassiana ARSEF 2860]|uniref:Cytidine and deoxycytidylate deaminase zinc-binding region n=1 Tax=Beauveria bassiana (strain ARSEF 2860) TaxID=655819 RepID=J4VRN2_BEAB2|nr:cytidine and deoxycytidylate deaminase zinc-binding region [Beauveria bassiana ARSEF 2860]EJP61265.1 cytidine and deoxycytidylate deaminase zinc-binding region [Beauveria bassiana ARSEF 2860]